MTVQELKDLFNNSISLLHKNSTLATPELLTIISGLVQKVRSNNDYLQIAAILLDIDTLKVLSFLDSIDKAVAIETQLNSTSTTVELIQALTDIQTHPLIMEVIAKFVLKQ